MLIPAGVAGLRDIHFGFELRGKPEMYIAVYIHASFKFGKGVRGMRKDAAVD